MSPNRNARIVFVVGLVLFCGRAASAATITVNDPSGGHDIVGSCVLRDAITAANTQAQVGGCTAGSAGMNVIELPLDASIALSEIDNSDFSSPAAIGANGLPFMTSSITIHGNGATIYRTGACNQDGVPDPGEFRIIAGDAGVVLVFDNLVLENGCADADLDSPFAGAGGAMLSSGDVTLRNVRVAGNFAKNAVGAILLQQVLSSDGSLTIDHSIIDHNTTGSFGMTVFAGDVSTLFCGATATLHVFDSIISDNGAGAFPTVFACGTISIEASTITANGGQPALRLGSDGTTGAVRIKNSIVADNAKGDCSLPGDSSLTVIGANLSSDASCPGFSLQNTPANLDPTLPHGPNPDSAALDAVADCTRVDGITPIADDQRGIARPLIGGAGHPDWCDIGAIEYDGYDEIFTNGFELP